MLHVEHVAWQVRDPEAVAAWYGEHLRFRVLRKNDDPARTHFLADRFGRMIVEIYNNPAAAVPEYASNHFLQLHLAFATDDPAGTRDRLLEAGCTVAEELRQTPVGDTLVMMRDPFGFAIQLCKRARPMMA
ncbi:MAG: VOC family protein [Gemmatimonadaceae bacterium]|nr:VOC family protein [Gemmatimonadaceae bacterium]